MTQNACPTLLHPRYSVLLRGLSWLGGFGLLSGGMVLAQGATNEAIVPTPTDSSSAVSPLTIAPLVQPSSSTLLEAPTLFTQPVPENALVQPITAQPKATPRSVPDDRYDAPTSIVLTERSTGCRAVLQSGQLLDGSPCALDSRRQAASAQVATGRLPANVTSFSIASTGLGTSTTPTWQAYYNRTARPTGRLGNGNIRLIFPLSIPAPISSLFGWRTHPVTGGQRFHAGTDLAAPLGTPVLAAYAGKVAIADFLGGYGLAVALDHNKTTQQTVYAHLSEIFVKPGEWVKQGMVIGRVGSTGLSTGPHLHFEFRQLTPYGWVAMDAGAQLEYALAQLVKAVQVAQAKAESKS